MYEKTFGAKYEETKDLSMIEVAKLIKKELNAAFPGFKWSVRNGGGSTHYSLDIRVTKAPAGFVIEETVQDDTYGQLTRKTAAAQEILDRAHKIVFAYNYDGSDIQSDYFNVRFYGRPEFDWQLAKLHRAV